MSSHTKMSSPFLPWSTKKATGELMLTQHQRYLSYSNFGGSLLWCCSVMVFPTFQISVDQVSLLCRVESEGQTQMYPPCITYSVQKLYSSSNSPLSLEIHVRGAQEETNFTISSTGSTHMSVVQSCVASDKCG